ncbi:MAG: aspartate/glutamate racemase family protein [Roseicyclus sp.]|uniref:aspartate/glutamate racemase family protein n=1 Tax=Roseicyclus sp. TaxID=1914329 RepID=UPI003A8359AD
MTARIILLNPNSTTAMTDDMVAIARAALPPGMTVSGRTNRSGPPAIQGEADVAACLPGLFDLARDAAAAQADAIVIGCFDDTGLTDLRAAMPCPVVGLGEAGMLAATLAAPRFAVLTTTDGSVPAITANITAMGLMPRCDTVRAAQIPVLDLPLRVPDLRQALVTLAADTRAGAIVLGCAGMGSLAPSLAAPGLPVLIDPVRAAVLLAAASLSCGFRPSATA